MIRKPHHSVPPTGEMRLSALADEVDLQASVHGSPIQRALYGDLAPILRDPQHDLHGLFAQLALGAVKMTPPDLANSIAKQTIFLQVTSGNHGAQRLSDAIDTDDLSQRRDAGSWLKPISRIGKTDNGAGLIGGVLYPTQTNYPNRVSPIKHTISLFGLRNPEVAEFGGAAGWLLKLGIIEGEDFPLPQIEAGRLSVVRHEFRSMPDLTTLVNRRVNDPDYIISRGKVFDLFPAKNPREQLRAMVYTLYPEQLLDPEAQSALQRLIDYPWPTNLTMEQQDLSIDPKEFRKQHPDDIGRYDVVAAPTLFNQLPTKREQDNVLDNAAQLRKPKTGITVFQDYGRFKRTQFNDVISLHRQRDMLEMFSSWGPFTHQQWVDGGKSGKRDFKLVGRFENGRTQRWALTKEFRRRIIED